MKPAFIAFHTKPDFSDLPNQDAVIYSNIQTDGDTLILSLKEPLRKAYPAGCPVRNQYHNRLWTVSRSQKAPHEWTKFSGKIKGINLATTSNNQWWPGTERARVFLLIPDNVTLEFKDVAVTKISE
ncbi:hypothetical protein SDC9_187130 [bioreactor metagenome]|uniref:Uncharacterized protein n=1 Tax=bioreactor metagenome TaxID=1076179 RepID=A0A645HMD0_9ZZZZ